ncbi:MAG: LysR family transcriptional regulator [Elusimicrobia bacterium]|nr:LysR family transcriptional regulator [Elusimicrobiota bacterium]
MIDLNALQVFATVAKTGGVRAAARRLEVTQPAVSQRLRALERSLGAKLYGRAENRLVLTEAGQNLLAACQSSLDCLVRLDSRLMARPQELQGVVRLISLSEYSKASLLPKIQRFRKDHPGVRFMMEYRPPSEMLPMLFRQEADVIFTKENPGKPQVEARAVFTEEYVFVGPRPRRRISWEDLGRLPILSCRSEDAYWYEFQDRLAKRGIRLPPPAIEVAEFESLFRMAGAGLGYVLAPLHAVRLRATPGLAIHELPFRNIKERIFACRMRTVDPGPAAKAFWERAVAG